MKLFSAFLRLIRWPNLVFIALTQVLFHFCVVIPSASGSAYNFPLRLNTHLFVLLSFSIVLVAAAGYIINDYFDINIDQINKPHKMVIDKLISRRWALLWHLVLSALGVLIGIYISLRLHNWLIALGNLALVGLLWHYSTTHKRRLLSGNILISVLTAWVVLVLLVAEIPGWWTTGLHSPIEKATVARLTRIAILYAGFAFILSLIREVVKDMEDLEGDRKDGCRTMPIVWGINAAKVFAAVWLVVLIITLLITQGYTILFGWWWSAAYIVLLVIAPLVYIFRLLYKAQQSSDYGKLSGLLKLVMLTGILSMVFFRFYTN